MLPAHQRLEAGQLLGRQIDDGLVENLDLVLGQRLAQIALERDAIVAIGAHLGPEDLDTVGAAALGAVHGDLGLLVEVEMARRLAVVHGDADRARQHDLLAGDLDRRAQRATHPLGQPRELLRALLGDEQDRELIAADTRQRVVLAEVTLQAPRDGEQQAVADDEAERDVHALELVDVDEDDARPHAVLALGAQRGDTQPVKHQLAVGQPGEAVVDGIVQQPLMRALGVGHIAHEADAAHGARIGVGYAGGLELEPAIAVVGMAHAEIGTDARPGALLDRPQDHAKAFAISGMQVLDEVVDLGAQLTGIEAERCLDGGADLHLVAPRAPFPHRRPRAVDRESAQLQLAWRGAEQRLERAEGKLGRP